MIFREIRFFTPVRLVSFTDPLVADPKYTYKFVERTVPFTYNLAEVNGDYEETKTTAASAFNSIVMPSGTGCNYFMLLNTGIGLARVDFEFTVESQPCFSIWVASGEVVEFAIKYISGSIGDIGWRLGVVAGTASVKLVGTDYSGTIYDDPNRLNTSDRLNADVLTQPSVTVSTLPDITIANMPDVVVTSMPSVVVSAMPSLDVATMPSVVVSTLPDVIIVDMPDVVIDSMPSVVISTMPVVDVGTLPDVAITSMPDVVVTSMPDVVVSTMPPVDIATMPAIAVGDVTVTSMPEVVIKAFTP